MIFQFGSISEFFSMGGYGFYVWLAYGITFLAVAGLIWQSKRSGKQTLDLVRKTIQRETVTKRQSS